MENFSKEELNNEIWKPIFGYDGIYEVSDLGRVRSLKFGKVIVLRPVKDRKGYLRVGLWKENKVKRFSVHRLVAHAFIPNRDESKTQINHRNEIKTDNRVENLEWCDCRYNLTYNGLNLRKKNSKLSKIEKLYDKNLTYTENLEIFIENGVTCSTSTLQKLRKDLGL